MDQTIYIVSGLPRSGTSMMMKMLEAGGLPVVTDGVREADDDNPKGYYELEVVKKIERDRSWLPDMQGKLVKLISQLIVHLPADYKYKVVFMRRDIEEVLRSQKKMLERRGEENKLEDGEMRRMFITHIGEVEEWLRGQNHVDVLYVNYNRTVTSPRENVARINRFLGGQLDEEKMAAVVDGLLYRQRGQSPDGTGI